MGMKSVRMSRTNHPMPTTKATSPRVAATYSDDQRPQKSVLRDREMGAFPKKVWPRVDEDAYPTTPSPMPMARDGKEGPRRGRQADKSSRIR